jgi:hypothetical protein
LTAKEEWLKVIMETARGFARLGDIFEDGTFRRKVIKTALYLEKVGVQS